MYNLRLITFCTLIGLIITYTNINAQNAEDLYQKGVQLEEIKGEPVKAIDVFYSVIKDKGASKETAARAQLHIGLCYEKLGKDKIEEAVSSFQRVIDLYPSQKDAVRIAREKLASINTDEADIRGIKESLEEWNQAYESKDFDKYSSYLSDQFVKMVGGIKRLREILVNNYFSKWKQISLTSSIKSIEKTGYNYVVDEEVSFNYTDWNDMKKSEEGVHRFLTFTKEDGKWKILSLQNQMLPGIYRKLNKNYASAGKPGLIYVSHITKNFVTVINPQSDSLIGKIPSGYGACCITFSKDKGYISGFNMDNVTVFTKRTNEQIAVVPAGTRPSQLLITGNGKYLFITHESNDGLWVMETKDNQIVNKIPGIHGKMLYDAFVNKIYASAIFEPYIYALNPDSQTVVKKIPVGGRPLDIAQSPDGKFVYAANFGLNEVEKIDTQTDSVVSRIPQIDSARGIAVSPGGKYAYVTNVVAGTVDVIDLSNNKKIKVIYVGRMPTSICIDKNNNRAYVSNQGGASVSVIDLKKDEVINTIPVADNPVRIQIF